MTRLDRHGTRVPPARDTDARQLADFTKIVFRNLGRSEQRQAAAVYLHGLLETPGRKSINSMVRTLDLPERMCATLRHFINESPWDWRPARRELLRPLCSEPHVWALTPAFIPKRGTKSPGVHRAFVPSIERTLNCQIALGLFLAGPGGTAPADWRLMLSSDWGSDNTLRRRARIPDGLSARPLWGELLELADQACDDAPVVAKVCTTSDLRGVLAGLAERQRGFVVTVPPTIRVQDRATAAEMLWGMLTRGSAHTEKYQGRRLLTGRVVLDDGTRGGLPYRLLADWPRGAVSPDRVWLTNLMDRSSADVLDIGGFLEAAQDSVRVLRHEYGFFDFEGRTFPGWHHHATLVSAAYCFDRMPLPVSTAA